MGLTELVKSCPDIQFIPIKENKMPIPMGWQKTKKSYNFTNQNRIGLVCGTISGNIEAIDLDLKYDLTGSLNDRFKKAVVDISPDLLKKLVVQKTTSGGFHWIYRCSEIEGNKKLARRPATEEEKSKGDKVNVLLETRGEGGYIACWPTPGYELIYGTFDKIQEITPEERNILLETARTFNEYFEEFKPTIKKDKKQVAGLSPFEDYDERGDVISLLQKHGWEAVGQRGSKTFFKRPGNTSASHSGNYDEEKKWFSVFSTSTQFKEEAGYRPYAVFAVLECNSDFAEASRTLFTLGYGEQRIIKKEPEKAPAPEKESEPVKSNSKDYSEDIKFLNGLKDKMSEQFINGKPKGETTCFETIDPHFTWLRGEVNVWAGHNNHGKSEFVLQLMEAKSIHSGYIWGVVCPENLPEEYFYDMLIESYIGKSVDKTFPNAMSEKEYEMGMEFIGQHFILVNPKEFMNPEYLLDVFQFLIDTYNIDGVLLDPWNSLTHDTGPREDQYLAKILVKIKKFTVVNDIFFNITAHPKTIGKMDNGEYKIPDQNDLAGGAMWGHKADNVLVIHRPYYSNDKASTEVDFISHKIKKQKQVGIPGSVRLNFDRKTRRYKDMKGNSPLHTIEVTVVTPVPDSPKDFPKGNYLDAFEFKKPKEDNWEEDRKY